MIHIIITSKFVVTAQGKNGRVCVSIAGLPHWVCSVTMAITFAATYKAFDNTKQGLLLGLLLAVGAPLGEIFIVNVLHLWHYDRPDFFGVPHWTGWCYAGYGIAVGNFGRYLAQKVAPSKPV